MTDKEYYGYVSDGMTLYHHGILGMHWGIRRFQPYRKGENVKGGKFVGRDKHKEKLQRLKDKTEIQKAENEYKRSKTEGANINNSNRQDKLQRLKAKAEIQKAENEINRSKHEGILETEKAKLDVATAKAALQNVKDYPKSVGNGQKGQGGNVQNMPPVDAKREALKQRIIRSGDPKLIKQYESALTNEEYRQAKERMTMRNELQKAVKDERFNKAKRIIDNFASGAQSVGTAVENVKNSYNKMAEVQNFLNRDNPTKQWKKIKDNKVDYAELQKKTAATTAREVFREKYGFDPYTGNRAKAIYKPDGTFLRYATTEEEKTGKIFEEVNGRKILIDTNPNASSAMGPQPLDRRYTMA